MNYRLWILLLSISLTTVIGQEDTCHLSCNGEHDLLTDPFDCSGFYYCTKTGIDGPYLCPEDRPFFNGVHCTTDMTSCCHPKCLPYCPHEGIEVEDPLDCNSYYICVEEGLPGEEVHFQCGLGRVYIATVGRCVKGRTCTNVCNPQDTLDLHKAVDELIELASKNVEEFSDVDNIEIAHLIEDGLFQGRRTHSKRG
ncbi:hypothetical protein SK128_023094 [Halocaridina rubra]|uniref:Chitin-binding type-2 domain-containing protein n=1 Tax=Halocaridina rubra TaxID=373956 RepID=A0AAN8WX33_HALRR